MKEPRQLPWQVFQLASSLLPYLDHAFEEVGLNPTDLFLLSHLKHYGVMDRQGRRVMLKNEIRRLLKRIYGYSETRASTIIRDLHNKGLVDLDDLTEEEREKTFGAGEGYKPVVILQKHGINKLDEFNGKVNKLFLELTAEMSETKFRALTVALTFFSQQATKKLQRTRITASL